MKSLLLILLMISAPAWSLDIVFGPEFTFGRLDNSAISHTNMIDQMYRHLVLGQPKGAAFKRITKKFHATRFESPNGWGVTVATDPGVIEVQMPPMTVEQFEKYQVDIQDAVFVSAANTNHWPLLWRGGGHINLSFETFKQDPLLFRNFIVDCYNHNELFMGVFGYDTHSALSWNIHPSKRAKFQKVLDEFDHGNFEFSLVRFAEELGNALNETQIEPQFLFEAVRGVKEFAINFEEVSNGRLEIRAVRPQASMDVWVRQIRLLRNRLLYLQTLNKPLEIDQKVAVPRVYARKNRFEPPVDPQEAMKAFYNYLTEAGEEWQDHSDYLWPRWGWDGEIKKFEKSAWFKKRQNLKCEKRLAGAK